MRTIAFIVAFFVGLSTAQSALAQENPLLNELIKTGVRMENGRMVLVPPPSMPDGLNAAAQHSALERIADANHPLSELLRKSVVAPQVLKISDVPTAGSDRVSARRVELWFVAYGDLETVTNEGFLKEQVRGSGNSEGPQSGADFLTPEELKERNISVHSTDDLEEKYMNVQVNLFDHALVEGTAHAMRTRSSDSAMAAALLDSRFLNDPKYPNRWQSLVRGPNGVNPSGQPHPYTGVGGYVKATQLVEPKGALLVEYHIVFDEPYGWFNGANFLRSKLPLAAQDSVRDFRRKLIRAQGAKAAKRPQPAAG